MVLYELCHGETNGGEKLSYSYWKTKREAMAEVKAMNAPDNTIYAVDRIETPRLDADLFLAVLNGMGFVTKRKTVWENPEAKRVAEVVKKMGWILTDDADDNGPYGYTHYDKHGNLIDITVPKEWNANYLPED